MHKKNAQKTILFTSISLALGISGASVQASLTSSAVLDFTLGAKQTITCTYGTVPPCIKSSYATTDVVGSYFAMDQNFNGAEPGEKTPIGSLNGIHIGYIQAAGGSHAGQIDGTESPDIDLPWTFFGGTGMHQTAPPRSLTRQAQALPERWTSPAGE